MNSINIKKGDNVVVIAGEEKGKTGIVLATVPAKGRVSIDGVNVVSKHKRPRSAQDNGGIVKQPATVDVSNVAVICPTCGKATKVVFIETEVEGKVKRVRSCKKCKAALDAKKVAKKAPAKRAPRKKKTEAAPVEEAVQAE
jgi:large subunit ribosomal protein L24